MQEKPMQQVRGNSYEAHITIEPVFGDAFSSFEQISAVYCFKPAELLLRKTRPETAERSDKDSFCTGHGSDFEELKLRTTMLIQDLKLLGFQVWRYKIEQILLDVRLIPYVHIKTL